MARSYTKKSDYWEKRKAASIPVAVAAQPAPTQPPLFIDYDKLGFADNEGYDSYSLASARSRVDESTGVGRTNYRSEKPFQYSQIDKLPLPWNYGEDGVDIADALRLVQKCYANIGIAKNSIDVMADTANTPHYLEGGTDKSKRFVNIWFDKIGIEDIKEQFYQESFRTGNVFFYKMRGNWSGRAFAHNYSDNVSKASPAKLPLKYVLLNSADIVRNNPVLTTYEFTQRFSDYELERMNNPITEKEKEIFKSIKNSLKNIDRTGIILKDDDIAFAFFGKQDYEPFALPFLWPVLGDINLKMEMKRRDQAILRLINNAILLMTTGNEPDKHGVNKETLAAINRLFQQEAVGRTLVSDYTTKGEFIIPDLKKVIYPEKYQIVNEDIKEGLSNILFGTDAKYGNLVVKVRVFLQKMKKARRAFEKMMQREIDMSCEYMGLVNPPKIKTDDESLEDPAVIQKTAIRLLELGVITPEDAIPLLKNRIYPAPESLEGKQKPYLDQREDGKWMPLVGGQPLYDNGLGQAAKPVAPKAPAGKPKKKGMASTIEDWTQAASERAQLENKILSIIAANTTEQIKEEHKSAIKELTLRVFRSVDSEKWESAAMDLLKNPEKIESYNAKPEIVELAMANTLSLDDAALWYRANEKFEINSQITEKSVEVKEHEI